MTDEDAIGHALSAVEAAARDQSLLRRNGRLFMALPARRLAALHTFRLYQPQRLKARCFTLMMQIAVLTGLHRWIFPKLRHHGGKGRLDPEFGGCLPGTAGVMLGSPEHRVRRAIAAYQTAEGWEVAKLAFGGEGARVLEQEAQTLIDLHPLVKGVPRCLGLHRGEDVTLLRMPYLSGSPVPSGKPAEALDLLDQWITDLPPAPIVSFPEWPAIESALGQLEGGGRVLNELSREILHPVICHGDFARWNLLKQADGKLVVLDWEWGHSHGMPGIDVVHYFLQDARLVERLSPTDATGQTRSALQTPACRNYLNKTGWRGDPLLSIIASLAYKQGAGHQENAMVLKAAMAMTM